MTEWLLKREARKVRADLEEMRERIATMRQTYEAMEKIHTFIRNGKAA